MLPLAASTSKPLRPLLLLLLICAVLASCAPTERCRLRRLQRVTLLLFSTSTQPSPPLLTTSSVTAASEDQTGAKQPAAAAAAGRALISQDDQAVVARSPSTSEGFEGSESSSTGISIGSSIDGTVSGYGHGSADVVRGSDGESASGLAGDNDGDRTDDSARKVSSGTTAAAVSDTTVHPDDGASTSTVGESGNAAMSGGDSETGLPGDTGFGDGSADFAAKTVIGGDAPIGADASGRLWMRRGNARNGGRDSKSAGGCHPGESCYETQVSGGSDGFHSSSDENTGASSSATATGEADARRSSGDQEESHNEAIHAGDTRDAGDSEMKSRLGDGNDATGLESDSAESTGLIDGGAAGVTKGGEATGLQDGVSSDSGLASLE